jgi:hypothetical protein
MHIAIERDYLSRRGVHEKGIEKNAKKRKAGLVK